MLQSYDDRPNVSTILATITPSYKLTDNLEYRFQYSLNSQHGSRRVAYDRRLNVQGIEGRGFAGILATDLTGQQFTNTLNYNNEISSNLNLNAVIGHEYLKYDFRGTGMAGENFTDAGLAYYDYLQYTTQTSRGIFSFASPIQELQSYFGRAIVNYLDKYLLTATLRADGSSKFGANNRYGYFPSLALAWVASNEDFLKGNSVVNNLKLRASWGKTGNQEFAGGASLARYSFGQQSISQQNFPNPDLKWETSTISNIGADYSLFNDRFFGFIDYFYKKTTDVLFEQDVIQPGPAGPKYWINLPGNIVNNGLEVSLNAGIVRSRDINWNAGVNLSFLQNKVEGINGYYETGALHGQGISGAAVERILSKKI
jgi:iron complex outermembrane receptor protein